MSPNVRMCALVALSLPLLGSQCGALPGFGDGPAAESIPGPQGPQGEPGPAGPRGDPGDSSVLSWAVVGRNNSTGQAFVFDSGGPLDILRATRLSEGIYEIEYDVPASTVGVVAISVTGNVNGELPTGENVFSLHSAEQQTEASNLTVHVSTVLTALGSDGVTLTEADGIFSIVIFGELP